MFRELTDKRSDLLPKEVEDLSERSQSLAQEALRIVGASAVEVVDHCWLGGRCLKDGGERTRQRSDGVFWIPLSLASGRRQRPLEFRRSDTVERR